MKRYLIAAVLLVMVKQSSAQINPFDALYFQNAYLANSAMAGSQEGSRINLGYRNQWSSVPGSPRMQYVSYETKQNKIGWGLSIINNREGMVTDNKFLGTFAIHLPLNNPNNQIHLGLNVSAQKLQYNLAGLEGNAADQALARFNDRGLIFDGDFGMGFSTERLTLEFASYNLFEQLLKEQTNASISNTADFNLFFLAASYRIPMENWGLTTKLAYRGVKNYTNLVDLAMEFRTRNEKLAFTGIYHSNKSASFGLSYLHQGKYEFVGFYNTTQNPISTVANGTFEIGLKTLLNRKASKN